MVVQQLDDGIANICETWRCQPLPQAEIPWEKEVPHIHMYMTKSWQLFEWFAFSILLETLYSCFSLGSLVVGCNEKIIVTWQTCSLMFNKTLAEVYLQSLNFNAEL